MKTKETAAQAYQRNMDDIGALLDLFGQQCRMHEDYVKKEGIHFGHVGDASHLRKGLLIALAQFAQQDEAFIVKHLDEMREGGK